MEENKNERYYSIDYAAKEAGVSYFTIRKAIKDGKLRAAEIPGRNGRNTYKIYESSLLEWVEDRQSVKVKRDVATLTSTLTLEDVSEIIFKMVQKAHDDGYKEGTKAVRDELKSRMKDVLK